QGRADLTMLALELADRYRNPALVLTDGFIGQMIEPLELHPHISHAPEKPWAVKGTHETRPNAVTSIHLEPDNLEAHVRKLEAKYKIAEKAEATQEVYGG